MKVIFIKDLKKQGKVNEIKEVTDEKTILTINEKTTKNIVAFFILLN